MKAIYVACCGVCPYRTTNGTKSSCSMTTLDVTKSLKSLSKNCPLPNSTDKVPQKKKDVAPKFDESEMELVFATYDLYRMMLPTLKQFDVDAFSKSQIHQVYQTIRKIGGVEDEGVIKELFMKTSKSDFLMGKKGMWKADFNWLLRPARMGEMLNANKVLNGNYDNKPYYKNTSAFQDARRDYKNNTVDIATF